MTTQPFILAVNKQVPKRLVFFTFLLGIFMGALDNGIVGPALSSINEHYHVTTSWGVWSFTIYTLFFAVSIPVMGKLFDRFGRKTIFTTGISLFAIGSLLSAFAPSFTVFLIGRAIQAIGTGGIFPITAAQIVATYPPEKRGTYLGYIGVVFGAGSILGPVAGGLIIEHLQWQWIFLINVPIAIIILTLLTQVKIEQQVVKKPIDTQGIFLLTATILSIMLGIILENVLLIGMGIALFFIMIPIEKKAVDPVMYIQYFTKRNTLFILLLSLASGFIMASTINLLPLFSETTLGLDKGESGLGVTPLAISSMIASLVGEMLVDKIGAKIVLIAGFVLSLIGAVSLAFVVNSILTLVLTIIVMGFGIGIIIGAPLNVMILQNIKLEETGSAVGYLSLFRSLGSTMGPTIAGIILTVFDNGFMFIYIISTILTIASLLLILALKRNSVPRSRIVNTEEGV
ncbi:MFS transporter [Neobacillus drentensis]|uniref:MFS transporter n=1 Tax=Neobacillus drentensis TaxID=220684 RepID=UPI00300062F6